jgi:hypothetical protein
MIVCGDTTPSPKFRDGGLADFEFEVVLIEESSGSFPGHSDGDVAGFEQEQAMRA